MKKTIFLLIFLTAFNTSFAQWNTIDEQRVMAVWLVQPNDGWAFDTTFRHWDGTGWTTEIQDSAFRASTCAFTSPADGWVFGNQDSLYRYNGSAWNKQYSGMPLIRNCDFFDSNNGWLMGWNNTTYNYQNGSWVQVNVNLPSYISFFECYSISASSANNAWMTSMGYFGYPNNDTSYILKYSSGQWIIDTAMGNVFLSTICFTDQNHGWACGHDMGYSLKNVIYKYNGSSWEVDTTLGTSPYNACNIYMYNDNLGWASVYSDTAYSIFGYDGSSWSYQFTLNWPVKQFSFVDPLNGWALGINNNHPNAGPPNTIFNTSSGGLGGNEYKTVDQPEIDIFPNPVSDKIIIGCVIKQKLKFSLFNILGDLVLQKDLYSTNETIDISSFPTGVYIVKVASANRIVQKKIIKE